jgi:hypothetical protein
MDWNQITDGVGKVSGWIGLYEFATKSFAHRSQERKIEEYKEWFVRELEIDNLKDQKNRFAERGLISSVLGLSLAAFCTFIPVKQEVKLFNLGLGLTALLCIDAASSKERKILALSHKNEVK